MHMNKTINVSLPQGLTDLAKQQVKAGYYSSISEVIRDALRKNLMEPTVPTFKMSQKAEIITDQAEKDYQDGSITEFTDFNELLD